MISQLETTIKTIRDNPYRIELVNASHWLAESVMGWKYINDDYFDGYNVPCEVHYDCLLAKKKWQPFERPDHTRLLVREVFTEITAYILPADDPDDYDKAYYGQIGMRQYALDPYGDDPTHDGCRALEKLHADGILTDEIMKGWAQ